MGTEPHRSKGVATTGVALSEDRRAGVATTGVALQGPAATTSNKSDSVQRQEVAVCKS